MAQDQEHDHDHVRTGVANPAVIDLFGLDEKTGEVVLAMREPRPWDGSDERLHELQEKFNAYVSFLLDGEMNAAHPELAGKRARIELREVKRRLRRGLFVLDRARGVVSVRSLGLG